MNKKFICLAFFGSSEHEEAAAWLPQYAYDDDDEEEGDDNDGGNGDSQFLPLEESQQARDNDDDDDDDTNTRNGDDESMNSLIGSTYRASKRTVDHPDPQVSRSLFLLSNLASSLYGGGAGSRAASKPAVEEYELQEMSEEFPTTRKGDPISSDYLGTSFGSGNVHEEGDDSADAEDHGDWLVDTEQLLNPQFVFPSSGSGSESGSGVEAVESSSAPFIVTPSNNSSNRNDDVGNAIPSTKDTDEKLSFHIDDVSASYSVTTQYIYISAD